MYKLPAIMIIEKKDIFQKLDMGEYIWGDAFLYTITGIDFSDENNRLSELDEICKEQSWEQLGDTWNPLSFSECSELLIDSIEFDIAYSSARITPKGNC